MLTTLSTLYLSSGIFLNVAKWPAIKEVSLNSGILGCEGKKSPQQRNTSVCLNSRGDRKDISNKCVSLSSRPRCQCRGTIWVLHSCCDDTECLPEPGCGGLLDLSVGAAGPSWTLPQDFPPLHISVFSMRMCGMVEAEGLLSENDPIFTYTTVRGWSWEFHELLHVRA